MEEEDITEVMARMVMDFIRQKERRDVAQQVVESMVERVGHFNGDDVPKLLRAHNDKIITRDVDEVMRLEYFFRLFAIRMHGEVKEL